MAIVINPTIIAGASGGKITIKGNAGVTVTIKKDNILLGTVTLDSNGEGTFEVEKDGTYAVTYESKTQYVEVVLKPKYIFKPLNEFTWKDVSDISKSGNASNIFKVGDRKKIHLEGTVGTLSVNQDFWVYIIGFDHYGSIGIDFGTFKDAETGGNDLCLVDSRYEGFYNNLGKIFNMNHKATTNKGGWRNCDLRFDILGSCKAKNQQNAPSDTATNPVQKTLMSALPSDLRQVMKPMKIWTDNKGGGGDAPPASNVTTTVDYLPLLAAFEVYGKKSEASEHEQKHQAQYEYYKSGNVKVKNRYDTNANAIWWNRSPYYRTDYTFCSVSRDDYGNRHNADYSLGVAPIFRV